MRLLLVEDEQQMADALSAAMARFNIVVDHAPTLLFAEEAVKNNVHDVIVLDRQLPDGDGITLLSHLRLIRSTVPVIVLTAMDKLDDRVHGLDLGADDYLAKPFAVEELLARVRAVLRRPTSMAPLVSRIGRLSFDLGRCEASIDGQQLALTRRELNVLETLVRRQGRTVLRSTLEDAVYNFDDEIQSNALEAHVSRLRKKLSEVDAGVEIHGIRGVGYLLRAVQ